jgi:Spy/CpxP family protein refolding chaperone
MNINAPRYLLAVTCLAAGLAGRIAYADATAPATGAVAGPQWDGGHRHDGGGFRQVLDQLDLTPEQQTQVKAIMTQAKSQLQTLHGSMSTDQLALAAASPNDPNYPALLATAKANAAALIQFESDLKTQVYAVLSPAQIARIPAIVAAERAVQEARISAWRSKAAPRT